MPLIQNPTSARKLQRGLRLTELPDSVLAPETVGVYIIEDWSAPLSDQERGCMGHSSQGGVAAEFSLSALVRVGAPARYDIVVTKVSFTVDTNSIVDLRIPTAGLVGLSVSGDTSFTDFETPGRPTTQLGFDSQAAIPASRILWRENVLATENIVIPLNVRLASAGVGTGLSSIMLIDAVANHTLRVNWEWTESAPQG